MNKSLKFIIYKLMLKGIKILQFQGLAPSVFCGMYFADQGAQVILVARPQPSPFSMEINKNIMNRNKKCISLSLKDKMDKQILIKLIKTVDIIIDPYRPGVLQKQKLGPQQLVIINPKVILLRVTGYGQNGPMALRPGHDLNYISTSGVLKLINQGQEQLQFPANYMADFVSASLGISGTLKALTQRQITKNGYIVDCSLTLGCSYLTQLATNHKEDISKSQKNLQIEYIQIEDKRYVITLQGSDNNVLQAQIKEIVSRMRRQNKDFFKNQILQIAQIKKVNKIKDSVLNNPFEHSKQIVSQNKIPKRDQHRQQILQKLNLKAKL